MTLEKTAVPTVIGGTDRSRAVVRAPAESVRVALLAPDRPRLTAEWRAIDPLFEVPVDAATWVELIHSPAFPTDLVVLDAQVREPVSIAARVRTCSAAGARVIVLVPRGEVASAAARAAGAAAVLDDSSSAEEIVAAARQVVGLTGGGAVARTWRPAPVDRLVRPRLSAGERVALTLYVSGRSTKEVAAELSVRYETAKTYLRRVREKYARVGRAASRREELVARATEDGYI